MKLPSGNFRQVYWWEVSLLPLAKPIFTQIYAAIWCHDGWCEIADNTCFWKGYWNITDSYKNEFVVLNILGYEALNILWGEYACIILYCICTYQLYIRYLTVVIFYFQKRYATAVEVDNMRIKSRERKENNRKRRLVAVSGRKRTFDSNDLIYYTKSSDYCLPDTSLGSLGTRGR